MIKLKTKIKLFKLPSKNGWWIDKLTGKQQLSKTGSKEEITTRSINIKSK